MAAQPKRKITRAMQGKRRRGNTPKLNKDVNSTSVPLYKRGFFTSVFNFIGGKTTADKSEKNEKAKAATATSGMGANQAMKAGPAKGGTTVKKTARTQHKGA
jgi:hypothetical protein